MAALIVSGLRFRFRSLWAQCATPSQKLGAGDTVAARRRRDEARAGQALQNDPGLLVLRPAPAPARLDDLKPPEGTVRMTVHTHCSQREEHHAARRPSPDAHVRLAVTSLVSQGGGECVPPGDHDRQQRPPTLLEEGRDQARTGTARTRRFRTTLPTFGHHSVHGATSPPARARGTSCRSSQVDQRARPRYP